jgi:hypothetical protein
MLLTGHRWDEDITDGIQLTGRPHQPNTAAYSFFHDLNTHVRAGSRPGVHRRPFISATSDLGQALWWSYLGMQSVIAIDMRKAAAAGVLAWDVGGADRDLLAGTARNYALSSYELVFHQAIPADCCIQLQVCPMLTHCCLVV